MDRGAFGRATLSKKGISGKRAKRKNIMAIRLRWAGGGPTMSSKHTFKIAGTREFDIVPSLVCVNTIVTVEESMGGKSARTKVISGDLSVDKADELFRGSR